MQPPSLRRGIKKNLKNSDAIWFQAGLEEKLHKGLGT